MDMFERKMLYRINDDNPILFVFKPSSFDHFTK